MESNERSTRAEAFDKVKTFDVFYSYIMIEEDRSDDDTQVSLLIYTFLLFQNFKAIFLK